MKSIFCFVFILFLFINISSQENEINVQGNIKDKNNIPISLSTIELSDPSSFNTIAYTMSKADGSFSFTVKPGNYILYIRHLRYNEYSQPVTITRESIFLPITLLKKETEIEAITIQANNIGRIQNDTLSYNLKYLTSGYEEKLKDIINKIPGMNIQNGKIKVNGKEIDHLLVEGKSFFGDNQKIATENINADMIGGIDFIKNYTNSHSSKDLEENSEKTALNIKIKEEFKNKYTGDLSLLSAYEERYNFHANLYKFTTKFNFSFISGVNNTNEEIINGEDYSNMNVVIKKDINSTSSIFPDFENEFPSFLQDDPNIHKNNTQTAAINFSYTPTSKIQIDGFSLLNNSYKKKLITSYTSFLNTGDSPYFNSIDSINSKINSFIGQTKLNISYTINSNSNINYSTFIEPSKSKTNPNYYSLTNDGKESRYDENNTEKHTFFGHQLGYSLKIDKNKLLKINIYQEFKSTTTNLNINGSEYLFNYTYNSLYQHKKDKIKETGIISKYSYKINKYLLSFSSGYLWRNNSFYNYITNLNTYNTVSSQSNYFFANASFSKNKSFIDYFINLEFRNYNLSVNDKKSTTYLLPSARIQFNLNKTQYISLFYKKNISYPSANKLITNPVLVNFRTQYSNSIVSPDKELVKNDIGIEYFYLNLFRDLTIIFNSNYTIITNPFTTNTVYIQSFNTLTYLNSPDQKIWNTNFNFEKNIKFIKTKIRLNAAYNSINQYSYINSVKTEMHLNNMAYELLFRSNWKKSFINFELGINYSLSNIKYPNLHTSIKNNLLNPYLNTDLKLSNQLQAKIINRYEIYKSSFIKREFYNLGFKLTYNEKNTPWKFWIEGNDILNISGSEIIETSTDNNILQREIYHKIPGYAGVGISYNL